MFPADTGSNEADASGTEFAVFDPFLIIQKTQGRMAEDNFWIQIEM